MHMIHEQVRAARLAAGISVRGLAQLAGVAKSDIERFEAGRNFTYEFLMKLMPHLPGLTELQAGPVRITFPEAQFRNAVVDMIAAGLQVLAMLDGGGTGAEPPEGATRYDDSDALADRVRQVEQMLAARKPKREREV